MNVERSMNVIDKSEMEGLNLRSSTFPLLNISLFFTQIDIFGFGFDVIFPD